MRERGDNTKYGFPPLIDQQLPNAIPWDTGIADLTGLCISLKCPTCGTVDVPLRYLAAHIGHKRTLRSIVPKLRCRRCGSRPDSVKLRRMNDHGGGRPGYRASELDLLK